MSKLRARFLSVLALVCRVPFRASFEPDYSRSDFWLPALAPLASAAALAGGSLACLLLGHPVLAALGALALQYSAFNLFHLDGLLDTADAMMPWATAERRLEILKDSRIGSYAFFVGFLALAAKVALLSAVFSRGFAAAALALLAAPLAGRLGAAVVPLVSAPARPGGLGALMKGFAAPRVAAGTLCGLLPLALIAALSGLPAAGLAAAAAALAGGLSSGLWLAAVYRRKVGGFTGDALGAAVEAGELLALLAIASAIHLGLAVTR